MGYGIHTNYNADTTVTGAETVLHTIDMSANPGMCFTVKWEARGVAVIDEDTWGVAGSLQGFFQRVAGGDIVPIPADASPIMVFLVGTAPVFDADVGTAPTLTGAISGTTLTLSAACADADSVHWVSHAEVEGVA